MALFLLRMAEAGRAMNISLLRRSCIIQEVAKKARDGRGRGKQTIYFQAGGSAV